MDGDDGGAPSTKVSDIIPFLDFANLLEKVSTTSNVKDRISALTRYVKYFREKYKEFNNGSLNAEKAASGDSIFCLIRLLLPADDRARASYNIKATVFGKMFGKILGLSADSLDGMKLIGYKDPGKAGNAAGDLSALVAGVLENRFSHVAANGPSLGELHRVLDQLAKTKGTETDPVTQEKQIKILQTFVRRLSPVEGKWLTRIILKAVKLDLSHAQILNMISPRAKNLLKTMSLEQLCLKLNDPEAVISEAEGGIVLFNYFRPMLCARLDNLEDDETPNSETRPQQKNSSPRKKEKIELPSPPFVIETKWDGERFQIHYEMNTTTGISTFKYFSRQGFDFTSNFEDTLTSRLKLQIVQDPPAESFILDGEMMAWQKDQKTFTQKGGNIDVKRMNAENPNHCPTFVAFDIVQYNNQVLIKKPLMERMKILRQVLVPKGSVCQLSGQSVVHSRKAVVDALNTAIDNLEEGLVVKSMNSTYEPGQRITTWLKIKPEYVDGSSVADLDLLILGAYYTDTVGRGGTITHLLAGLVQNTEFYPLVKLGSGRLGMREMEALVSDLRPNFSKAEIPGVKFTGRKRPDFFIDPKKSIVVQVKATEILYSKEYELSYTLRFARITQVRRDKSWKDAMSVKEFHQLRVSCEGKLAKRTDGMGRSASRNKHFNNKSRSDSEGEEPMPGSSSYGFKARMSPTKKPLSPSKVKLKVMPIPCPSTALMKKPVSSKTTLFASHVFNVVGNAIWKEKMEALLKSHGAEIVQNPTKDLFCVIAEKISRRVQNIITDAHYDIVKESWVERCIAAKKVFPFQFEQMFFAKEQTRESFSRNFDEFGDSYASASSLQETKELVTRIIETNIKNESIPTPDQMKRIKRQIDDEVFPTQQKLKRWSFFSDYKIAFRGEIDETLSAQIEFYGGTVAQDELDPEITHVVLGEVFSPRKKQHLSAFVVKRKWLLDSLEKKEVLSELPYTAE